MCFSTLKGLGELKLISDDEKVFLKDLILNDHFEVTPQITFE